MKEVDVDIIFPFFINNHRETNGFSLCVSSTLYVFSNQRFGWLTSG